MSLSSNFPAIRPSLLLDFQKSRAVDPRVTFTRATTATYFDEDGILQSALANVPRIDFNPSTLVCNGLLIEEQRTNSIRNNTMVGAVAGTPGTVPTNWSVASAAGLTTNVIGTGTSGGVTYIDLQITGTTTGTSYVLVPEAATQIAALNGQAWASSAWWSVVAGNLTNVTAYFFDIRELDSGGVQLTSGAISVSAPTSTFTRIAASRTTSNASTAFVQPRFRFTVTNSAAVDFTLRIGLPQLELGAFATSVIPTTTTALTRNADVASMTGTDFSSWYNQSSGSMFVEFSLSQPASGGNQFLVRASDNSYNNAVVDNVASTGFVQLVTASGGVFDGSASAAVAVSANTNTKFCGAYATNDIAACKDGGTVATDTSATIPTALTRFDIGSDHAGVNRVKAGTIRRIAYYPTRLANTTLQALTG
jgi:hypothetical protein